LNGQLDSLGWKLVEKNKLKRKNNEENYIIWPIKKEIENKEDIWKTEKKIINGEFNQEEAEFGRGIDRINYNSENSFKDIDSDYDNENYNNNNNNNLLKSQIIYEKYDLENLQVKNIDDIGDYLILDNNGSILLIISL